MPGVIGAMVGARSPQQAESWIDAADLHLTPAAVDEIAARILVSGFGPSCFDRVRKGESSRRVRCRRYSARDCAYWIRPTCR
jgi:hypothetical protein